MDLICTNCNEPWGIDIVLHDEPELFQRRGAVITSCPTCPTVMTPQHQRPLRAMVMESLGDLMGDDIDGAASLMEDFDYMGAFEE